MKNFSLKNILIYIIIYSIIITKIKSLEESIDNFLEDKTLDYLRQMFWTLISYKNNLYQYNETYFNLKYEEIWRSHNRKEVILILKEIFNSKYINSPIILSEIKDNNFFKINNLNDLKKLIENKSLPKNYLINFAFNIDKYDRTKRKAINSVSDYLNFYTIEQIKDFIYNKLNEYFDENSQKEDLEKIILNNYKLEYNDTKSYIASKEENDFIQFIYGYEKYCFNSNNKTIEDSCNIAYSLYTHSKLETYSKIDFNIKISAFNRKLNFENNLDEFIFLIENRKFTYPNNYDLLKGLRREKLFNNIIAFETYYRRQTNTNKKLRKLNEYIDQMKEEQMRDILNWGINLYPELGEQGRLQDIISSENNLLYGQVKDFIKITHREDLLKYAYNIHIYQNNITSIYDKEIFDFLRMNDNQLYDIIFKDTNNNQFLQVKENFTLYATLHANNFEEYLKNLQRNQLKILVIELIELFYTTEYNENIDVIKMPSEKKEIIDSLVYKSNSELIEMGLKYGGFIKIQNAKEMFAKYIIRDIDSNLNKYFYYNENIMDFFRSIDINYLRLWLRKYELIIRKLKSRSYISGGLKTNFMRINEYTKNELLSNFDIYIFEYPDLFAPEEFIKIVGLDTGITPHKYLVENVNNNSIINNITFSLVGHLQRKNIQANIDLDGILSNPLVISHENIVIKNRHLYELFRLINICPELNNKDLFEIMCINEETKIINSLDFEKTIDSWSQGKLDEIVNNINYYYEKSNQTENIKYKDYDSKNYIMSFLTQNQIENNEILKSRVIDGDFYSLFYDYTLFLKDEEDLVINNIYALLEQDNKTENIDIDKMSIDDKRNAIAKAIYNFKELQDPSYFDQHYNYIDTISEGYSDLNIQNLYNFLNTTNNREIFYYCLLANILLIENGNNNRKDIYLIIHYMSRISMIRYILDVAKLNDNLKELLSPNNLPKLVKKYMLDIGSDNIYDLTVC